MFLAPQYFLNADNGHKKALRKERVFYQKKGAVLKIKEKNVQSSLESIHTICGINKDCLLTSSQVKTSPADILCVGSNWDMASNTSLRVPLVAGICSQGWTALLLFP